MSDTTADQLRALLSRAGLSTREAARRLQISDRELRRMVAGTIPIPNVVALALTQLAEENTP